MFCKLYLLPTKQNDNLTKFIQNIFINLIQKYSKHPNIKLIDMAYLYLIFYLFKIQFEKICIISVTNPDL